jgi:carbamoyl-phosphate synthase/aspartate carbamoyltransferase
MVRIRQLGPGHWQERCSLRDSSAEVRAIAIIMGRSLLPSFLYSRERFDNPAEYESVKDLYVIDNDVMAKAKATTIVMHPLPRNKELDEALDFDVKRAAYFRQMRYGLYVSTAYSMRLKR